MNANIILILFKQIWGTLIMQKRYKGYDYFLALLVTLGCSIFILFPVMVRGPSLIVLLDFTTFW